MGPHREFRVALSKNKQTRAYQICWITSYHKLIFSLAKIHASINLHLSSRYSSVDINFLQQVQVQQCKSVTDTSLCIISNTYIVYPFKLNNIYISKHLIIINFLRLQIENRTFPVQVCHKLPKCAILCPLGCVHNHTQGSTLSLSMWWCCCPYAMMFKTIDINSCFIHNSFHPSWDSSTSHTFKGSLCRNEQLCLLTSQIGRSIYILTQ